MKAATHLVLLGDGAVGDFGLQVIQLGEDINGVLDLLHILGRRILEVGQGALPLPVGAGSLDQIQRSRLVNGDAVDALVGQPRGHRRGGTGRGSRLRGSKCGYGSARGTGRLVLSSVKHGVGIGKGDGQAGGHGEVSERSHCRNKNAPDRRFLQIWARCFIAKWCKDVQSAGRLCAQISTQVPAPRLYCLRKLADHPICRSLARQMKSAAAHRSRMVRFRPLESPLMLRPGTPIRPS